MTWFFRMLEAPYSTVSIVDWYLRITTVRFSFCVGVISGSLPAMEKSLSKMTKLAIFCARETAWLLLYASTPAWTYECQTRSFDASLQVVERALTPTLEPASFTKTVVGREVGEIAASECSRARWSLAFNFNRFEKGVHVCRYLPALTLSVKPPSVLGSASQLRVKMHERYLRPSPITITYEETLGSVRYMRVSGLSFDRDHLRHRRQERLQRVFDWDRRHVFATRRNEQLLHAAGDLEHVAHGRIQHAFVARVQPSLRMVVEG